MIIKNLLVKGLQPVYNYIKSYPDADTVLINTDFASFIRDVSVVIDITSCNTLEAIFISKMSKIFKVTSETVENIDDKDNSITDVTNTLLSVYQTIVDDTDFVNGKDAINMLPCAMAKKSMFVVIPLMSLINPTYSNISAFFKYDGKIEYDEKIINGVAFKYFFEKLLKDITYLMRNRPNDTMEYFKSNYYNLLSKDTQKHHEVKVSQADLIFDTIQMSNGTKEKISNSIKTINTYTELVPLSPTDGTITFVMRSTLTTYSQFMLHTSPLGDGIHIVDNGSFIDVVNSNFEFDKDIFAKYSARVIKPVSELKNILSSYLNKSNISEAKDGYKLIIMGQFIDYIATINIKNIMNLSDESLAQESEIGEILRLLRKNTETILSSVGKD